jgi:hypothetical protein
MLQAITRSLPFAALLGAAAYLFARTLHFDFPRAPGRLGPDVWPQAILVLLVMTCAVAIGRALLVKDRAQSGPESNERSNAFPGDADAADPDAPSRYWLVAGGLLLFVAYPVALDYLGFLAATFLLMALFMLIGQWRNVVGVVTVSAVGTLALFYIFRGVVYVSLPLGRGPFHDATVWIASLLGMR